ncbi:hypothetical protein DY000_02055400 [Brassica cretica]|uniref:Uncharacterized protein n=1 Tax=Brassica cretica TaxID=69181 RepID=A0ABQ7AJG2_BRACR|nr:hypothetical protein DY000_02055400 [Brassica cretica]
MKTSVSATILEEALNGRVSVDPLLLGQTVTKKVEKQRAHFYAVKITEQEISSGLVFRVESPSKSKFKLLFFDQEADGGLSLAMQEDSRRTGKITCAGMYFLGFPVYSLDHTITSMSQEKDPETALFKSLDGFHQCEVTELKAGTQVFAVYGDNFFKSVNYTIQVLCATSFTQEKEDLRSGEAQILTKRAELAKFETEYREVLVQFTDTTSRYAQEMQSIDELLKQRNEIHSAYTTVPLVERSSSKNRLRKSLFKKAVAEAPAPIDQEEEEEEEEESSRQRNKKPNTCDESKTLKKKTRWYNLRLKLDKKKPC